MNDEQHPAEDHLGVANVALLNALEHVDRPYEEAQLEEARTLTLKILRRVRERSQSASIGDSDE